MTKDIEREAFEATQNTKVLFERIEYIESNDAYMPKNGFGNSLIVSSLAERLNFGWSMWKSATERAEKKLEGSVVAPVWISVDFLLPDLDSKILIYIGNEVISAEYTILGFVDSIEGAMLHQDLITYWTQLPNGPEADTEG